MPGALLRRRGRVNVEVLGLVTVMPILVMSLYTPHQLLIVYASPDEPLLKIVERDISSVKVYYVTLNPEGYDYVYENMYVFIEDVRVNKAEAYTLDRDWDRFIRLIGNSTAPPSIGLASFFKDLGIDIDSGNVINSTSLLIYVYSDSGEKLNEAIINKVKTLAKKELGMDLRSIVFYIYPMTREQYEMLSVFDERMNKSFPELLNNYGVDGFGFGAITCLPIVTVNSTMMEEKGVTQKEVLDAIKAALGNLDIPIEVRFSNYPVYPATEQNEPLPENTKTQPPISTSAVIALAAATTLLVAIIVFGSQQA